MVSVIEDTGVPERMPRVRISNTYWGKSYDCPEIDVSFAEKEKKTIEQRALFIST